MGKGGWLLLALLLAGCDRAAYRRAADRDAYCLINSRVTDPAFAVGRTRVEPDPASRLFDPFDPDRPPRPPDEPAARQWMDRPGGMKGGKRWDRDGVAAEIEHDGWKCSLPLDAKGRLPLDEDRAMELALLHSREYQTRVESLYLTALDVSLARFQFRPQWFGRHGTSFSHFGSGGLDGGESNTLTVSDELGFTRALAAGGQVLVDFANSFVWEYVNGGARLVTSNLALSLMQPLLRGASREVRLEPLTQSERELFYAVRDFARFRKEFWADVTTQEGYLNLLLQVQNIRNQQANLKSQAEFYRLYGELFAGEKVSSVQVDQVFRGFMAARLSVAQAEAGLQTQLDAFKLRLGLPPRLPVELDDSRLAQFQLVSKDLEDLREEAAQYQLARYQELNRTPTLASLRQSYAELHKLLGRAPAHLARIERELDEAAARLKRPPRPGQDPEQLQRTAADYDRFRKTLREVGQKLGEMSERVKADEAGLTEATRKQGWQELVEVHTRDLLLHLDDLIAAERVLRINAIELPGLDEAEEPAIAEAHANRLDLMNAKARVTDAWRKVRVAANALRGDLNVTAAANLGVDPLGGNPVGFSAAHSRYTLGLSFDAPLNRFAERNNYRASLINYQRARRDYMALADRVEQQVRRDLRDLAIERLSFEIARQNLLSAARQVEFGRYQIIAAQREARGLAGTSSTLDILNALSALLQARNDLVRSYISFEQLRIQLLLDLERLRLDSRGFPTDEQRHPASAVDVDAGAGTDAEPLPPPRPAPEG